MAKKNENRVYVDLKCSVCGCLSRPVSKNKKNTVEKLELNKYCSNCGKKQTFKEKK